MSCRLHEEPVAQLLEAALEAYGPALGKELITRLMVGRDAEDVRAGLPPNPALDRLLLLVFK